MNRIWCVGSGVKEECTIPERVLGKRKGKEKED